MLSIALHFVRKNTKSNISTLINLLLFLTIALRLIDSLGTMNGKDSKYMNERIAKLTELTLSGQMYANATKTFFEESDLLLPRQQWESKRICEYILNQEPVITEYSTELGGFARRQVVVAGTKKTVEIKPLEYNEPGGMFTGRVEYSSNNWNDAGFASRCDTFNRYDKMMTTFAAMVRGEVENPYTYDYELELYKTVLKACGE